MAKKQGRSRGKGSRYERIIVIGILIALVAIALTLWGPLRTFRPWSEKRSAQQARKVETSPKQQSATERRERKQENKEKERREKTETRETRKREDSAGIKRHDKAPFVAIIIDDLGQDLKIAREILSLPAKVTIAIIPGLPQSRGVADLAKQSNREMLLHLPMEYRNKNGKPAPGMLRSDMTPMDFLNTLSNDLESVPGAIGVNNHEGSLLTENKEAMKFLMAELKSRDLIFLDSLTTPKSVAYATAKEFGLKATRRDVFLDNDSDNEASIQKQLEELTRIAKDRGRAVGIGHPHPATITVLRKWIATASQQGIEIVPVSYLVK